MQIAANINYLLLSLLFLAMAAVCVLQFLKIRKLNKEAELAALVNSASIGGYYLWRKDGNVEEASPALTSMLRIRSGSGKLAEISEMFEDSKAELLEKFEALKSGSAQTMQFNGQVELQDGEREYYSVGCSILDKKTSEVTGVILWFCDISDYTSQLKILRSQNTQLAKEIKEYSNIFNTLPIPIWKRDDDYKIRFCNFVYSKFIGDENEGGGHSEIPELDQSLYRLSMLARDHNRPLKMKKHLVVDGERRFYNITEMAIKNSNEMIGFAYDITAQDEIEKELSRHISAHADLLESSSSAMAVYGPDTKLRFYNNAFVNLWSLKVKWLDSNPTYGEILEVLREKRKLPEQADFKKFRKEQMMLFQDITKPHEDLIHLPDGKAIRMIAIPHALGGLLFAYEDVTDRLAMERSFNTLIAVQRETLDNLSEGVALFSEDGRIRLYNPVYVKMWLEDEDFLAQNPRLADLMERQKEIYNYRGKWENFKERLLAGILGRKYSTRREKLTNGHVIDIISRPLPNGDTLVSFVDVTDSIMAEKALLERNDALIAADKLKTEFLANISYELRNPLTSIIGFSEALQAEYFGKLNGQQMDYVNGIYSSSTKLLDLINDVLDLTSIEAGYMMLEKKKFNIYEALNSVVKLFKEGISSAQSINLVCDEKIGSIIGDEIRIKQVIFKLLSNAINFTSDGGSVTIGAEDIGKGQVKIWVEDTGVGIESSDKKKVFERFFKTRSAQLMKKSGAGLGLAVVKNIVELHNGTVDIESKVGKGTKVSIILNKKGPGQKVPLLLN